MGLFDFSAAKKAIKDAVRGIGERVDALRNEIGDLERKRSSILSAGAARSDVEKMARRWIDQCQREFEANVRGVLDTFRTQANDVNSPDRQRELANIFGGDIFRGVPGTSNGFVAAIASVFGQNLIAQVMVTMQSMDWPNEGLPLDQRDGEVDKLTVRIKQLTAELETLLTEARAAGINLD